MIDGPVVIVAGPKKSGDIYDKNIREDMICFRLVEEVVNSPFLFRIFL